MATLKGIEVTIQVNDVTSKEYVDQDEYRNDDSKTISRYIEATSGAPFGIKMRVPKVYKMTSDTLGFSIAVDGSE